MNNQIDILPTLIRKAELPEKLTEYPNEEFIRPAIKEVCDHDPRGSRVITEYFEKGTVPTQTCDIHVAFEVCKTSDKLATKNCPANKKQRKIYIVRKKGSHGKTADTPYMLPKKYQSVFCKKH